MGKYWGEYFATRVPKKACQTKLFQLRETDD